MRLTYEVMLGRKPESDAVIQSHIEKSKDWRTLVTNIARSAEFSNVAGGIVEESPSPFWNFNSSLDVRRIVESYAVLDRRPAPGFYVNYLGLLIPTRVMGFLEDKGGQLDHIPVPANFHADMAEWAGALRAVDLSGSTFSMLELGCGWGCWMGITGVAARSRGKTLDLTGIEGDPHHIELAQETFAANGVTPQQYSLLRGVAAAGEGYALFSKRTGGGEGWGFAPKFGVDEAESVQAVQSGQWDRLEMVSLARAIGRRSKLDLLHMDIQGGEDTLVKDALPLLNERVAYMVIGTHSRAIEGRLMDTLLGANWKLEIERPQIFTLPDGIPQASVDGVQAWRNPRLC